MNIRNWPIRSQILALVTVPLAALLALWLFATTLTVGPALDLLAAGTLLNEVGRPGEALVAELQRERRLSLVYLADRGNDGTELHDQRNRTDHAMAEFRRRTSSDELQSAAGDLLKTRIDQTITTLDALSSGRGFIDRREMDRPAALRLYNGMVDAAFGTFTALATLPDEELNRRARAITQLGQAREVLGQADALLAGAFTADQFGAGEYHQLVQIIGIRRHLYAEAVAELPEADRVAYQRLVEGAAFVELQAMEETLVTTGRPNASPPISFDTWRSSYDSAQQQLRDFELAASDALVVDRGWPVAVGILVRLAITSLLGLGAVIVSGFIALRIGRSLVRRLTGLRAAALELASTRLPSVVGRLRRGEEVDVEAEVPRLEYGADEIGQVGQAFTEVQHTAVRSAVDEAALRRGLSEVFLNIARRSQTLLHRQLALLDQMERRTTDPEELADLFRIDHLATRMRRHAEDLVILAGAAPGRGWRHPVPMIDVIRGAVSEVEDYVRVDVLMVQPAAITGHAVGDVIHLLAELIENATAFSPPHTRVQVSGQAVAKGYVLEVVDSGLGMSAAAIEETNQRLATPPDFDPANSSQLGLFVVAQLSARHGVRVRLRVSPHGGITAVVLVPTDLVVDVDDSAVPDPLTRDAGATRPDEERAAGQLAAKPGPYGLVPRQRSPEPEPTAPAVAVESTEPAVATRAEPVPMGGDGLPRRIRQSSLAPQLRTSAATTDRATVPAEPSPRSPDEVRARMAALQAGTERGRREAVLEAVTVESLTVTASLAGPTANIAAPTGVSDQPVPIVSDHPAVTDGSSSHRERDV